MSYHQTIYNLLRQAGMTEAGALGVLGNWECESNCEPYRLQGDFSPNRTLSKEYVHRADNNEMTEAEFAKPVGFSLAQWTYPQRKINLWRFWKAYGGSLGNIQMLVEFALKEFKTEFIPDWRLLCSTGDIREAAKAVCDRYENPAIHNVDARYQAALRIKAELELGEWEQTAIPETPSDEQQDNGWENIPATEFWPPRIICEGMEGKDVVLLRSLLYVRDLTDYVDDSDFDGWLKEIVKKFQKSVFPNEPREWDGIVGEKTWSKLLAR